MDLRSIAKVVARERRAHGWTLPQLATQSGLARSTLAALEAGKLRELGFNRVARLCAALGLVLELRSPALEKPLMEHRHLTEFAGRELTKAAIDDVIVRGDIGAWRGLVKAIRADSSGRIARRTREVLRAAGDDDQRAKAFAALLRRLAPRRRTSD